MTSAGETLGLARDVPGVLGSFLLDGAGRVLARDLPDVVSDAVVATVGRRCGAAVDAVQLPLPGTEQVVLRFDRLTVVSSRAGENLLVVLAEAEAQTPVVRIATRATAARLATISVPEVRVGTPGSDQEVDAQAQPPVEDRPPSGAAEEDPAPPQESSEEDGRARRRPRRGRGVWG